jgi:hypothetical protein
MSDTQRYCTVPVADYDDIDMEQVAATYGREVVLNPPIVANGTERLIGFCGNKPTTLYGKPTYTEAQWQAEVSNPESAYYVDSDIV